MICQLPYCPRPTAELVRTPFLYPASGLSSFLRASKASDRPSSPAPPRLIIEVGPGRGDFLFHLATAHPEARIVGIEIKRKRVDRLIARTERRGLANVCIVQDDARDALPRFFHDGIVDEIHVHFPDPWPKKRHAKNRAVDASFLGECRRVLKPGGALSIVTDSAPYADEISACGAGISGLSPCPPLPGDACPASVFPSLFAQKWQAEGRRFFALRFLRTC